MRVGEQSRIMSERPRSSPKRFDAWCGRAPGRGGGLARPWIGCQSRNDSGGANITGLRPQLEQSLDV